MTLPVLPDVVVFDAVGTVIHPGQPVAETYFRLGSEHGSACPVEQIRSRFNTWRRRIFETAADTVSSESVERQRWLDLVRGVFSDVARPEPLFECLWDYYADPRSWRVYEDVPSALDQLAGRGIRLAIASNFDQRLIGICASLPGLAPIGDIFCSSLTGFSKPDQRFFQTIADSLKTAPEQIWMIGDHLEHDVRGPRLAGWNASHLNRAREDLSEHLARHSLAESG